MFSSSGEKMVVSFTIISKVAVTTLVSINKIGTDLFVKNVITKCLIYVEIEK